MVANQLCVSLTRRAQIPSERESLVAIAVEISIIYHQTAALPTTDCLAAVAAAGLATCKFATSVIDWLGSFQFRWPSDNQVSSAALRKKPASKWPLQLMCTGPCVRLWTFGSAQVALDWRNMDCTCVCRTGTKK